MAATLETVAEHVKPLQGAIIRRYTAGAAVTAGAPVYLDSSGYVQMGDSDAVATNAVIGCAVQGATASGERIDVVIYGPINNMTAATPGALVYTQATAGALGESAGTKTTIIGKAESATILLVQPSIISLS